MANDNYSFITFLFFLRAMLKSEIRNFRAFCGLMLHRFRASKFHKDIMARFKLIPGLRGYVVSRAHGFIFQELDFLLM